MTEISSARKDVLGPKPPAPQKIYAVLFVLSLLVLSMVAYMAYDGMQLVATHTLLVDAAMEIKLEVTTAHLWFEEIINGDRHEDIQEVWDRIDAADWYARAILRGGEGEEGVIVPIDNPDLRREILEVQAKIGEFRRITEERLAVMSVSGIGSEIDQRYDTIFRALLSQADTVESMLQAEIRNKQRNFKITQYALMSFIVGLFGAAAFMFHKYSAQRAEAFAALQSEQKRAEAGEKWLSTIMNSMGDGVITTDAGGRISYVNPVASALTGWAANEAKGRQVAEVFNIVNEDTGEPAESPVEKVLREGLIVGLADQTALISRDGTVHPIADSGAPIKGEDGRTLGVVLIFHDITERRRAEKTLRESEEKYRSLFENMVSGFAYHRIVLDENGKPIDYVFLEVNDAFEKLTGLKKDLILGKRVTEILSGIEKAEFDWIGAYGKVAITGETLSFEQYAEPLGRWYSVSAYRPKENHFVTVFNEITDRKKAEDAMRESEERYRNVYNTAPIAFVLWDCDCLVTDWNRSAEKIFGWTRDEVIGRNFFKFLIPDEAQPQVQAVVDALLQGKLQSHNINENLRKDGEVILCEWNNSIRYNQDGDVVGAISLGLDITERVRAEEEIRMLNEELEQRVIERTAELAAANKELETFAYSVSHDLRTPLRGMDGFSKILLEDYAGELDERGKDYLGRVRAASQRMGTLIDDLLSLSRVSRAKLRRMAVDLSALAESVASDLRRDDPNRRVTFKIVPGLKAQGDPQVLGIALENLLGNAWKFSGNREDAEIEFGVLTADEAKAAGHAGKEVYFIRDNGAGFDMAYAGKLFGAFQRLHSVSEFPGTGIGLATVQRIIHRHGGSIWAEGKVDKGATFYFVL